MLKQLFDTLYSRESLPIVWEEQNEDLLHYLENRGNSENYESLINSALEEWNKIEKSRNRINNRIEEIEEVRQNLNESINRLEQYRSRVNGKDDLTGDVAEIRRLLEEVISIKESSASGPEDNGSEENGVDETQVN